MKKIKNISPWILTLLLILTNFPFVGTAAEKNPTSFSGQVINPYFEDLDLPLDATVKAQTYKTSETSAQSDYTTDQSIVCKTIRDGLKQRAQTITVHFRLDYRLSSESTEANEQVLAVAKELFNGALAETNDPTEGDSLQYCYSSWHLNGHMTYYPEYTDLTLIYTPSYFTTKAQEDALTAAVDALMDEFGFTNETTDREKADTIYGYITDNITYDYENLEDETHLLKFTAYAALIDKTAVCEGYAVLFYRLAEECGLDARVITGYGGGETMEKHAWNIVQMGSTYYYLDATWDAERIDYAYYLKGNSDFTNHINDPKFNESDFTTRYPIPDSGKTDVTSSSLIEGNYRYRTSGKRAIIEAYLGNEADITVPAKLNGYTVYYISSNVFSSNQTVEKLTLNEGVRRIGAYAIYYCNNLKELHLPSTLKLESYSTLSYTEAPTDCPNIATLTVADDSRYLKLLNGVLYTADMKTALYAAPQNGITEITLCEGTESIGNSAFAAHRTLQTVTLPDTVTEVGYWAFSGCYELSAITLSENTEWIGQYAFLKTALSRIDIPATTTKIMRDAFAECYLQTITVDAANEVYSVQNGALIGNGILHKYALSTPITTLTVPQGITEIGAHALQGARELVSVTLPAGLQKIGQLAFGACTSLSHIDIPDGVTTIDQFAFSGCDMLVSLCIPASVTDIGDYMHHPSNLATIYGESGSAAHTYAVNNGHPFKVLTAFQCADGHDMEQVVSSDTGYTKTYHYACGVCGDHTKSFVETHKDISSTTVTLEFTTASYTGTPILPRVLSVMDGDTLLVEGVDYTVGEEPGYNINVGTTGFNIWGIGDYYGSQYVVYTITQATITDAEIEIDTTDLEYNGTPLRPDVTVTWKGKTLTLYEDYSIQYLNNNSAGEATVVISGNRNFKDSKQKSFTITAHQHSYSSWMPYGEAQHYRVCACGRDPLYADHTYDNSCDTVCNDCTAERSVTHQWSSIWLGNDTYHWKECDICHTESSAEPHVGAASTSCTTQSTCEICHKDFGGFADHEWQYVGDETMHRQDCKHCTATQNSENHSGGRATCTQKAICDICQFTYGAYAEHVWHLASDDIAHWQACENCTATDGYSLHAGGSATCTTKAICTVCQTPYGALAEHELTWTGDNTVHWQECDNCTHRTAVAGHSGGNASCTQRAKCDTCQIEYGSLANHQWKLKYNEMSHWQACENCTATQSEMPHAGGTATCTQKAKCDTCKIEYGSLANHQWKLKYNEMSHWQACENCTATQNRENHSGGTATCTQGAKCVGCGIFYGSLLSHKWSSSWNYKAAGGHAHTCTSCGARDTLHTHKAGPAATVDSPQLCTDCGYILQAKLQNPFTDVKEKDYFFTPVLWAVEKGITAGVSPTSFAPAQSCTRAQVVSFLWRAAGCPESTLTRNPFTDVKMGTYYYKAVLWAVEKGITAGTDATHFSPAATCTRGQIVSFLYRFAGNPIANTNNPFKDVKQGAYYYNAVLWAVKNGITAGTDATHFSPDATCTRGQVVSFLYRYMK